MKVCVLLSTYNGAEYLEEQLDSILAQTGFEVDILVRDDGSTDSTKEILQRYQDRGALNVIWGENIGWRDSFMELVYNAPASDYYAFCDQDDIWLPEKLVTATERISLLKSPNRLYCSNTYYYKNGKNFGVIKKHTPRYDLYTSLVQNIATGCTMLFNHNLREVLLGSRPKYLIAHDFWVYQVAMLFGEVYYDDNAYIYYRQHDNNQIGANSSLWAKWRRRVKSFFATNNKDSRSMQAKELLSCYAERMNSNQMQIVSVVANYKQRILLKIKLLFDRRYSMGRTQNNVLLRLRILCGKL